ncbi:hypothetical protein H7097_00780, partial [Aeromicrobium sp.]|nr:hypothetical protein [Candidatus Saccharibacteria bacterium]
MPKRPPVQGQQLVNNFQTALISLDTSQAAQFEAERSENALVEHLRTISSGSYLQPVALDDGSQDAVTRASLDAHIKKVQAEQINQLNTEQLANLQAVVLADFRRRKVRITVVNAKLKPIESIWYDQNTGYRNSINSRKTVVGVIDEILLDRNALVIKPVGLTRFINKSLTSFVV